MTVKSLFSAAILLACATSAQAQFIVTVGNKTVNNPNPGGHPMCFYIDGAESPALTLVRGQTYTFQVRDITPFHFFYITTSSTGAGAGLWSLGVTPSGGAGSNTTLTFTVPASAPAQLYYQCKFHLQMGWKLNIVDPTVTGTVTLGEYSGNVTTQPVTFEVLNGGTVLETHVANLAANGSFSFPTTHTGTFSVAAKAPHWLRELRTGVVFGSSGASGVNFSLVNADVNNDNAVDIGDYSQLSAAYSSFPGDPNWNPEADLNGDDGVDIGDYSILSSHYGDFGD